jgi:hypothetical protein
MSPTFGRFAVAICCVKPSLHVSPHKGPNDTLVNLSPSVDPSFYVQWAQRIRTLRLDAISHERIMVALETGAMETDFSWRADRLLLDPLGNI